MRYTNSYAVILLYCCTPKTKLITGDSQSQSYDKKQFYILFLTFLEVFSRFRGSFRYFYPKVANLNFEEAKQINQVE